jgi:hypothetical protein
MNEVERDKAKQGSPCYECPYCRRKRWWQFITGSRCAHSSMLHPVSGEAYQSCEDVRGVIGGKLSNGKPLTCLGYFPDEHAVRWSR